MQRESIRWTFRALLAGLMLTGCGGAPEEELADLGTRESAICSGSSVSNLTISNATSWGGELVAIGDWTVTYPANGVHLDFYVDGVLRGQAEREGDVNRSGTYNFSYSPVGCGSHTFEVKAYPMTFASGQATDWCPTSGPQAKSTAFSQSCPTASLSCSLSGSYINCTGSGSGGSGSLTPYWQKRIQYAGTPTIVPLGWAPGSWTKSYYCPPPLGFRSMSSTSSTSSVSPMVIFEDDQVWIDFKVRDSSGMESTVRSSTRYACGQ
jgi:hypothetical protein